MILGRTDEESYHKLARMSALVQRELEKVADGNTFVTVEQLKAALAKHMSKKGDFHVNQLVESALKSSEATEPNQITFFNLFQDVRVIDGNTGSQKACFCCHVCYSIIGFSQIERSNFVFLESISFSVQPQHKSASSKTRSPALRQAQKFLYLRSNTLSITIYGDLNQTEVFSTQKNGVPHYIYQRL